MEKSPASAEFLRDKERMKDSAARKQIIDQVPVVIDEILIDFNYEIDEEGDALDYKRDLKSPERVKAWRNKLLSSYEKELKKGKAAKFT
nr:hypothetical protein [uncultured Sphingomonas sp.]